MKINGKEVDMQKIVFQYETENKLDYNKTKKGTNLEWWSTTQGLMQREKNREMLKSRVSTCHRQKIKYLLTETKTKDQFTVVGQKELAYFLGFETFNSHLRSLMNLNKQLPNKFRTKFYDIEEIL